MNIGCAARRIYHSRWLIPGILFLGLADRIAQYLYNKSLWLDEASLAVNFFQRGYSDILQPFANHQAAPVAFLLMTEFMTTHFGFSEYTIRFIPQVFGVLSLLLFVPLSSFFLKRPASIIALVLFAFSESAIYYSSEFKQYSIDVFFSILILYLTTRLIRHRYRVSDIIITSLSGVCSVWFSHPSIFVLGGAGLILLIDVVRCGTDVPRKISLFVFISILCMASIGVNLIFFTNSIAHQELYAFWKGHFPPMPPVTMDDILWYPRHVFYFIEEPIGLKFQGLVMLSSFAGIYTFLCQRRYMDIALLVAPVFVLFLASILRFYPMQGRLILFIVPIIYIVIAEGVATLFSALSSYRCSFGFVFLFLILLYPVALGGAKLFIPGVHEEVRPLVDYIAQERKKDDTVYVYYSSVNAFNYYNRLYGMSYVEGINARKQPALYLNDASRMLGRKRIWFLFSHVHGESFNIDEEKLYLLYLDRNGARLDEAHAPGASVYLYDLSQGYYDNDIQRF